MHALKRTANDESPDFEGEVARAGQDFDLHEGLLVRLSAAALHLVRGGRDWPLDKFGVRAADVMRDLMPVQAMTWGSASLAQLRGSGFSTSEAATDDMNSHYMRSGLALDPAHRRASDRLGVTVNLADVLPHEALRTSRFEREFMSRWGVDQALCTVLAGAHPSMTRHVSVWRNASQPAFTESDRRLMQFMAPHLLEAHARCRLRHLRAGAARVRAPRLACAIFDSTGALLEIEDRCAALLRAEWPHWTLARPPQGLAELLAQPNGQTFRGKSVALEISHVEDLSYVQARRLSPLDALSARERGVAERFAGGQTGQQIAAELGISASTVGNHLTRIYKKLGVASKLDLRRQLDQMGR
jgi:DNA-binding CsgD family transcriptional regulator